MAKQEQKVSGVLAALGPAINQSIKAHAADATDYGMQDLPAGISNGIAQLSDLKFDLIKPGKENAGKPFFYAAGIVKMPKEHNGIPIYGLRTSVMEMIFDTKKGDGTVVTRDEHIAEVLNYYRMISGNEDFTKGCTTGEQVEALGRQLLKMKPHFRFRTWSGDPSLIEERNGKFVVVQGGKLVKGPFATKELLMKAVPYAGKEPRVSHFWGGWVEFKENAESLTLAATTDDSAPAEESAAEYVEAENTEDTAAAEAEATEGEGGDEAQAADIENAEAGELPDDPAELAAIAADAEHAQTTEAGEKLLDIAEAAGVDRETAKAVNEWSEVVDMIVAAGNADTEPEPAVPEVNQIWHYHPVVKGKKVAKPVDAKILKVYAKTATADVRLVATKAEVKGVKFADLIAK